MFILALVSVLQCYAFSLLKTTVPSFINDILVRVCLILLTIAYYYKWFTLDYYVYLTIGVYFLQVILIFLYILYEEIPGWRIDFKFLKSQNPRGMIKYGFMLSFTAMTSIGLRSIDSMMLGHYRGLEMVAIYAIAALFSTVIEVPLNALEKIAGPSISRGFKENDMVMVKDIYYKSAKYLLLMGGLLFIGININIHDLYLLTPKDYSAATTVVLIVSFGTLINMATGVNDSLLFNSSRYIYGTYMLLILFGMAVITNMIFIPIFGMEGAALATCLSSFVYNFMKFFFIRKFFKLQPFDIKTLLIIVLIAICFGINYFLPLLTNAILNILFHSTVITAVYAIGTYSFRIVPELHRYIPLKMFRD
jgi:O-antigen/teichoic acid export membrane protein